MNIVEIKNLTIRFGNSIALNNINLNVEKGKITGLIGSSGSGKTTLFEIITGLIQPDSGEINISGFNPVVQKDKLNLNIGYMPKNFKLYEQLTVIENLCLFSDIKSIKRKKIGNHNINIQKMLKLSGLSEFQSKLAGSLTDELKQKLGICCTMLFSPELILLDEPFDSLDFEVRKNIIKMVKNLMSNESGILCATANSEDALNFDSVIVIDKGKIIYQGGPYDLVSSSKNFKNKVIDIIKGNNIISHKTVLKTKPQLNSNTKEEKKIQNKIEYDNYNKKEEDTCYIIEVNNLSKKYENLYAIKHNSFKVKKGEVLGITGLSGAGKSTLIKMIYGIIKPTSGTIKINGTDVKKELDKMNIGYMPQKFSLYGSLTIRQNLDFFALTNRIKSNDRKKKVDEVIKVFGLKNFQDKKAEDLSKGLKQRLSMAGAVIHNPSILILDEPTNGVDILTRRDLWKHIKSLSKKGITILVTSNFEDETKYCDRIISLDKGKIIKTEIIDEENKQK